MTTSTPEDTIREIERVDADRIRATLGKDRAALERIVADDLLYVHTSATQEDKRLYLDRVTGNYYNYQSLEYVKRAFRVLGEMVLVNGDIRINVIVNGVTRALLSRYLQVWAHRDGRWQMVSWQSTLVPAS